jgi:endonuclease YncB( thermonuclease family)
MSAAMHRKRFRPTRRPPSFKPTRSGIRRAMWLVPLLLAAGALLDPSLIRPFGPLAAPPERVSTQFTLCRGGRSPACVVDGDSFRLGDRSIRITGIDAPEMGSPRCAEEAALARRSTERLLALLNQGSFDMIAHRLQRQDRHGRDLMILERNGQSIGDQMMSEGLAHRYIGSKRSWC